MSTNEELVQTFRELDGNGDGQITMTEFAGADSHKDGLISLPEFTEAWHRTDQ